MQEQPKSYHIGPFAYTEIEVASEDFLYRHKSWDYNTLVTDEDFHIARALHAAQQAPKPDYHPSFSGNVTIFRQQPWRGEILAMQRFALFTGPLCNMRDNKDYGDADYERLRNLGFQVHTSGAGRHMRALIAEERVDMEDLLSWAKKITVADDSSEDGRLPFVFPPQLEVNTYLHLEIPEFVDTKDIMECCEKDGYKAMAKKFPNLERWGDVIMAVRGRYPSVNDCRC